jgi:hypothetical protein
MNVLYYDGRWQQLTFFGIAAYSVIMGKFKNSHPMFVLERRLSIFFIRAYSVRYSASTTVDWKCKTCLALLYISNSMLNKTLLIVDVHDVMSCIRTTTATTTTTNTATIMKYTTTATTIITTIATATVR